MFVPLLADVDQQPPDLCATRSGAAAAPSGWMASLQHPELPQQRQQQRNEAPRRWRCWRSSGWPAA